jgi:hypothetical protein
LEAAELVARGLERFTRDVPFDRDRIEVARI